MSFRSRTQVRDKIRRRIRKKISGSPQRPRLAVFRSQTHIYAQVIDDDAGRTLCAASSLDGDLRKKSARGANVDSAKAVGALVAQRAKDKGIETVVFDRGGFRYHGRIKALAEAAREAGLKF